MKRIFVIILLITCFNLLDAQNLYQSSRQFITSGAGVPLYNRSYTSATSDVSEAIPLNNVGSLKLYIQTQNKSTILVSYELSHDNAQWTPAVTLDSLSNNAAASKGKSFDFTSIIQGASFIRLTFALSANAFSVTNSTYSVEYEKASNSVYSTTTPTIYWESFIAGNAFTRPALVGSNVDTASYNGNLLAVMSNSKTASSSDYLKIDSVAAQNGGTGTFYTAYAFIDTPNVTNLALRYVFLKDTTNVPRIADNSPNRETDSTWFPFLNYGNRNFLGSIDLYPSGPTGMGAGSSAVWLSGIAPNGIDFTTLPTSQAVYVKIIVIGSGLYKPKAGSIIASQVAGKRQVKK